MLPHRYPFRFLSKRPGNGEIRVLMSGGGALIRDATTALSALPLEIMAQASALILGPESRIKITSTTRMWKVYSGVL